MADDIRRVDLLILKDDKSKDKEGAGYRLAVVQWVKADKQIGKIQLAKMNYWVNENDHREYMKIKGLTLDDLHVCNPKWNDIAALMKNPPAVVPRAPAPAAAPAGDTDSLEEVPF